MTSCAEFHDAAGTDTWGVWFANHLTARFLLMLGPQAALLATVLVHVLSACSAPSQCFVNEHFVQHSSAHTAVVSLPDSLAAVLAVPGVSMRRVALCGSHLEGGVCAAGDDDGVVDRAHKAEAVRGRAGAVGRHAHRRRHRRRDVGAHRPD
jgi:hypothetical protein